MRLSKVIVMMGAMASCLVMSAAARAESGRPSRQTLEQMGLGSLAVMSDDEALAVRGEGFGSGSYVRVSGSSYASIGGQQGGAHSQNSYFAEGRHDAKGSNSSYAGVVHVSKKHNGKGGGPNCQTRPSNCNNKTPNCGPARCSNPCGGRPSGGGYGVNVRSTNVFAGGRSSAWAF